ncbi:MAG: hypothetical protein LBJ18_00630 [Rickettsiales bacterium]|jgi:hypothetical protein|nr:hypothetical protein [Rickettsiales bacterium]
MKKKISNLSALAIAGKEYAKKILLANFILVSMGVSGHFISGITNDTEWEAGGYPVNNFGYKNISLKEDFNNTYGKKGKKKTFVLGLHGIATLIGAAKGRKKSGQKLTALGYFDKSNE